MTTINAVELKKTLKSIGVKVLRVLTYRTGVILTIDESCVEVCERYFEENKIVCIRPMNAPIKAKANRLGRRNAAEFTSLYQL
jgi:hypothetical protein